MHVSTISLGIFKRETDNGLAITHVVKLCGATLGSVIKGKYKIQCIHTHILCMHCVCVKLRCNSYHSFQQENPVFLVLSDIKFMTNKKTNC